MAKQRSLSPPQVVVLGFLSVILIGTALLSLPQTTVSGERQLLVDALFTATSAVCVTGLVVHDTGDYFSLFGQIIILLLIQIGGLGYMTMATFLLLLIGKAITVKERLIMQESMPKFSVGGVVQFAKYVLKVTLILELIGATILSLRWIGEYPVPKAIYLGIFHAVSAFCNAGFALFSDSLIGFRGDMVTSLTVLSLVFVGGLGYVVISDLYYLRYRKFPQLSIHTKMVLSITLTLIVLGGVAFFLLESKNPSTLAGLPRKEKIMASLFQAVTPRTAGFSVVDVGGMMQGTLFLTIILMFIGASPGGTGGGIKTTTFGVMLATVWATLKGRRDIMLFKHRIPGEVINKSFVVGFLSIFFIVIITTLITSSEGHDFIRAFFETMSAFGTVGLSTGITSGLSSLGKALLIVTMFVGRLGPLTIGVAMVRELKDIRFRYPEERVLVG
ncbi:MAG: TrkH family potassium uptake protein [bacterium]